MSKFYPALCVLAILASGLFVNGQGNNVGIGTLTPDTTAILDITSSTKGVLVPRLTTIQRNAITAPAQGLLIYDTDLGCFYYYNSTASQWISLCQAGPAGPTGPQGVAGAGGSQGPQGVTGPQGAQGTQGVAGIQGPQGTAGNNGAAGPAGVNGATGPQGPAGVDGATGVQGIAGATGAQGTAGADGATGPQGVQGTTGADGATGSQGIQGLTGPTGPQGIQGVPGINASTGAIGATGPTGPQGVSGVDGASGAQGIQGNQGIQGVTGSQGNQGIQGATGSQGPQGIQGATGSQGPQGIQGATGAQGNQGIQGATGSQGPQGIQGATGLQGNQGSAGSQGPQGVQGVQGTPGSTGPSGPTGSQGNAGTAGAAGATGATGPVGCGVSNFVIKSAGTSATCSIIYDNGTQVGIGTVVPQLSAVGGGTVAIMNIQSSSTLAGANMIEETNKSGNGVALGVNNTSTTNGYNTLEGGTNYNVPTSGGSFGAVAAVWGLASASVGTGEGGSFNTNSSDVNSYGLYAQNAGVASQGPWAAYFGGDVYVSGRVTQAGSDKTIKDNIQPFTGVLEKLKSVNVYSYTFKPELQRDYGFSTQNTIGVIAQELETVFPDLVGMVSIRTKNDAKAAAASVIKTKQIKTVDYDGLIPVLLEAIKEQQKQIEGLNQRLEQIEKK